MTGSKKGSIIQTIKNTMSLNGGKHPIYNSLSPMKPRNYLIELASKINDF